MTSTLLNDPFSQSKDRYFFGNRILIRCLIIVSLQYFSPAFLLLKSMPIHSFSLSLGYKQASKWWWWCPPSEQVGDLYTFILPPLLQIWCFILVPRSIVEYLLWPLLPLCPHFQVTKQILVTYPVFLPSGLWNPEPHLFLDHLHSLVSAPNTKKYILSRTSSDDTW